MRTEKLTGGYNAFGYWILKTGSHLPEVIYSAEVHNGNEQINAERCNKKLKQLSKELNIVSGGSEINNDYFFIESKVV